MSERDQIAGESIYRLSSLDLYKRKTILTKCFFLFGDLFFITLSFYQFAAVVQLLFHGLASTIFGSTQCSISLWAALSVCLVASRVTGSSVRYAVTNVYCCLQL